MIDKVKNTREEIKKLRLDLTPASRTMSLNIELRNVEEMKTQVESSRLWSKKGINAWADILKKQIDSQADRLVLVRGHMLLRNR